MKKVFKIFLSYLLITFNSFVFADENKQTNVLKIGVLAPMSGDLKSLGEEMLYSINLALHDINDPSIKIYPKDSGSNKEKIIESCEEFKKEGIKIIIGPMDSKFSGVKALTVAWVPTGMKTGVGTAPLGRFMTAARGPFASRTSKSKKALIPVSFSMVAWG